jgi:hypothetical protein
VGNRAYLLSLPFAPIVFGEEPPSGTVAFAQYSLPLFWASLFDATSMVRVNGVVGLAAPRCEAGPRSERRIRACAAYLGWRSWPVADRWSEFLRSLGQSWIAVDVHEDVGAHDLADVLARVDLAPDHLAFRDHFGTFDRTRPAEDAPILGGTDHEGYTPPRPLTRLSAFGAQGFATSARKLSPDWA